MGTPCNGPTFSPDRSTLSAALAFSNAPSASRCRKQLSVGWTSCALSIHACVASTHEISPIAIAVATSRRVNASRLSEVKSWTQGAQQKPAARESRGPRKDPYRGQSSATAILRAPRAAPRQRWHCRALRHRVRTEVGRMQCPKNGDVVVPWRLRVGWLIVGISNCMVDYMVEQQPSRFSMPDKLNLLVGALSRLHIVRCSDDAFKTTS